MSQLNNIIQKINSDYEKSKEELIKDFENKKNEIKKGFEQKILLQKTFLEEKYSKQLELEKKRIFTEEFIKFSKIIETKKQEVLQNIFDKAVKKILNISKSEYKNFIKSLITKNLFLGKKNEILFDETKKISVEEQQGLINEILNENKDFAQGTEITISNNKNQKISFGIIIFSNKQSKDLSLESILNMFKTELEIVIAQKLFE
jgi:V/A-type H+-transporting ATPase subunit E